MDYLHNVTTVTYGNSTITEQELVITYQQDLLLPSSMKIFLTIYLGVVCLFGTFGNLLTLSAIYSTIDLHTVPNAYVCNLAVTDLLICLINTPASLISNFLKIPRAVCLVFGMIWYVILLESFLSLSAIALNRYIIICSSHSRLNAMCSSRGTSFFIAASWIYVLVVCSSPYLFGFGEYAYSSYLGSCSVGEQPSMWTFSVIVGNLLTFIPTVLVTSISYWKVLQKFLRTRRSVEARGSTQEASNTEDSTPATRISTIQQASGVSRKKPPTNSSKKKSSRSKNYTVAKNLFIVWICFILFWLPIVLLHKLDYQRRLPIIVYRILMALGFTNSAINIIIYSVMNKSFRHAYARLLHVHLNE